MNNVHVYNMLLVFLHYCVVGIVLYMLMQILGSNIYKDYFQVIGNIS